jgi:hypothetical protein
MNVKAFVMCASAATIMAPSLSIAKTVEKIEPTETLSMAVNLADAVSDREMIKECTDMNLDETQKGQIKDAYFDFRKQKNTLEAEIKNSWMDVSKTMMSATSTKDEASAQMDTLKDNMGSLGDAKSEFELKVFYDILKPEQRAPAFKCIMKRMKAAALAKLKKACKALPSDD